MRERPPIRAETRVVRQQMDIPACDACPERMVDFRYDSGDPNVVFTCAAGHETSRVGPDAYIVLQGDPLDGR